MLRCVVREDLSYEMATDLVNDMKKCIEWLDHHFIYTGQQPCLKHWTTSMMIWMFCSHCLALFSTHLCHVRTVF